MSELRSWRQWVGLTRVEVGADAVAEEEGDAAAALLVQGHLESLGDSVLARVVQAGKAEDEALLRAWRVALAKGLDDSTVMSIRDWQVLQSDLERTRS